MCIYIYVDLFVFTYSVYNCVYYMHIMSERKRDADDSQLLFLLQWGHSPSECPAHAVGFTCTAK